MEKLNPVIAPTPVPAAAEAAEPVVRRLSRGSMSKRPEKSEKDLSTVEGTAPKQAQQAEILARRRKNFSQKRQGSFDGGMCGLFDGDMKMAAGVTPAMGAKEKMDFILTLSKQKAMTADSIFSFFDIDADGTITKDEFNQGLKNLDPMLFTVTEAELQEIVKLFDKDGDGKVDVAEFKAYCYNLPDLSWRAEKLRVSRSSRASIGDRVPSISAKPKPVDNIVDNIPAIVDTTPSLPAIADASPAKPTAQPAEPPAPAAAAA
ncbi:hypothetical protein M885DRAFT_511269 [Pelagophyceae sp. CCMP2097]|nr:hypothetical protein M885DRAFT_511269 [Pelagophyceae sp. CCMP2097]